MRGEDRDGEESDKGKRSGTRGRRKIKTRQTPSKKLRGKLNRSENVHTLGKSCFWIPCVKSQGAGDEFPVCCGHVNIPFLKTTEPKIGPNITVILRV